MGGKTWWSPGRYFLLPFFIRNRKPDPYIARCNRFSGCHHPAIFGWAFKTKEKSKKKQYLGWNYYVVFGFEPPAPVSNLLPFDVYISTLRSTIWPDSWLSGRRHLSKQQTTTWKLNTLTWRSSLTFSCLHSFCLSLFQRFISFWPALHNFLIPVPETEVNKAEEDQIAIIDADTMPLCRLIFNLTNDIENSKWLYQYCSFGAL
jgi:hypothetical protein